MIVSQLQKDAEHLDDMSVQRLIRSYITKIYAHSDSVSITVGVNMVDCGDRRKKNPLWRKHVKRLTASRFGCYLAEEAAF